MTLEDYKKWFQWYINVAKHNEGASDLAIELLEEAYKRLDEIDMTRKVDLPSGVIISDQPHNRSLSEKYYMGVDPISEPFVAMYGVQPATWKEIDGLEKAKKEAIEKYGDINRTFEIKPIDRDSFLKKFPNKFDDTPPSQPTDPPELKFKYEKKLKKLGVYDQFVENFKAFSNNDPKLMTKNLAVINKLRNFPDFVDQAFQWYDTPEKYKFWFKIKNS